MTSGKYIDIWLTVESLIVSTIKKGENSAHNLIPEKFYEAGNRAKYGFRAEFHEGYCPNPPANSAVGRDLVHVLHGSATFKRACKGKDVVIRMGKYFDLHIEIISSSKPVIDTSEDKTSKTYTTVNNNALCFPPVADESSEILILGTMPGEKSLSIGEYYANKGNAMWKIIADIFNNGEPFNSYADKTACLLKNHIALWDTLKACYREGSLDQSIKDEYPNDIQGFLDSHPAITRVIANGKRAARYIPKDVNFIIAGSTSSSHSINYTLKLEEWRRLLML